MQGIPLSLLNNSQVSAAGINNVDVSAVREENDRALLDLIKGISNGETLLGKVLSSDEASYTFKTLDTGVTINAKAENGVILTKGATILFEVSKLSDSEITLRPLNVNTSSSVTAESALKAAGLPVNNRSLELTVRNMEYGNPIDRKSLTESYRDVALNPETPVKYIVDLQKMQIPVTNENLEQYKAYLNMKNVFVEDFSEIASALSDSLTEIQEPLQNSENLSFPKLMSSIETVEEFAVALDKNETMPELSEAVKALAGEVREEINKLTVPAHTATPQTDMPKDEVASLVKQPAVKETELPERPLAETSTKQTIPEETAANLSERLKTGLKEVFNKFFTEHLTLNEQELPDKVKIKDLYEKLYTETRKISSALEEAVPKENPAVPKITLLNNNIDFMNALNHFIPYVQIPFRGESGAKAGELYVYRNKSGKVMENDEVSAFLHLDMDHLGPTDVYVKMRGQNVNTEFTLADEASLDFIEKHMDYLDKRLSDKGYSLTTEGKVKERTKTPIEEAFEQSISKVLIARTSFDARI